MRNCVLIFKKIADWAKIMIFRYRTKKIILIGRWISSVNKYYSLLQTIELTFIFRNLCAKNIFTLRAVNLRFVSYSFDSSFFHREGCVKREGEKRQIEFLFKNLTKLKCKYLMIWHGKWFWACLHHHHHPTTQLPNKQQISAFRIFIYDGWWWRPTLVHNFNTTAKRKNIIIHFRCK